MSSSLEIDGDKFVKQDPDSANYQEVMALFTVEAMEEIAKWRGEMPWTSVNG